MAPLIWPLGGTPPGMNPKRVKRLNSPKAPGDLIPITVDFAGPLAVVESDYLSETSQPTATSYRNDGQTSDLLIVPPLTIEAVARTRITMWVTQGTVGMEYLVEVTAYSQSGQTIVRGFMLPVNLR